MAASKLGANFAAMQQTGLDFHCAVNILRSSPVRLFSDAKRTQCRSPTNDSYARRLPIIFKGPPRGFHPCLDLRVEGSAGDRRRVERLFQEILRRGVRDVREASRRSQCRNSDPDSYRIREAGL